MPYVMTEADHNDPKMTLGLYAKVIASKTDHGAARDGLGASLVRAARRLGVHTNTITYRVKRAERDQSEGPRCEAAESRCRVDARQG